MYPKNSPCPHRYSAFGAAEPLTSHHSRSGGRRGGRSPVETTESCACTHILMPQRLGTSAQPGLPGLPLVDDHCEGRAGGWALLEARQPGIPARPPDPLRHHSPMKPEWAAGERKEVPHSSDRSSKETILIARASSSRSREDRQAFSSAMFEPQPWRFDHTAFSSHHPSGPARLRYTRVLHCAPSHPQLICTSQVRRRCRRIVASASALSRLISASSISPSMLCSRPSTSPYGES